MRKIKTLKKLGVASALALTLGLTHQATAQLILIDFGSSTKIAAGYNEFNETITGVGASKSLVDTLSAPTGITLTITSKFNGVNSTGSSVPVSPFVLDAVSDSFYGNDVTFASSVSPNPGFQLSGLNPSSSYTFTIFASRTSISDNRSADYTFAGLNTVSGEYNPANNESSTLVLSGVSPTPAGTIDFDMIKSASNTNGNGFIYLGALQIEATSAVPEPSTYALLLGVAGIGVVLIRRSRKALG